MIAAEHPLEGSLSRRFGSRDLFNSRLFEVGGLKSKLSAAFLRSEQGHSVTSPSSVFPFIVSCGDRNAVGPGSDD